MCDNEMVLIQYKETTGRGGGGESGENEGNRSKGIIAYIYRKTELVI